MRGRAGRGEGERVERPGGASRFGSDSAPQSRAGPGCGGSERRAAEGKGGQGSPAGLGAVRGADTLVGAFHAGSGTGGWSGDGRFRLGPYWWMRDWT